MYRTLASLFVFIALSVLSPSLTHAQSNAGIGLKPAIIEEQMDPGQVQQYSIAVSNVSGADQVYYVYKRDISGVRDGGVPVFADDTLAKTGFELSEWIQLETETLEVPMGQERVISFIMSVPANATPGSHFGGIFLSAEPPTLRESGAAIGYEVGNIITIRVAGDAVERAQIRQFSTDNYIYGKPEVTFNVRIENDGTTLIRPTGPLTINNMFGKQVANLPFNEEFAGVFPGVTREFVFSWTGDKPGFGRYEAIVSPGYGEEGAKQTMSSTATFWILPLNIILPSVGVLAALLLITYVSVRLYVRKKLAYYGAGGGTRKLVRRRKENSSSALLLVMMVMFAVTAVFLIILVALFA